MNRNQKHELGSALKDKFSKAQVAIFADYKGLTAVQADEFRRLLRVAMVEVKVLKNNVARKVGDEFGGEFKQVTDSLVGPTMVAFGYGDPAVAAKIVKNFAKDNEALVLKDSVMGNKRLAPKDVEALADLPSREVMLGMFLGVMMAPVRDFVCVLAAVPRGFVTALSAIEKKKAEQA
ncbi:MAG: 50S ribosomal protein L10 [Bdellovibrionales bacterium]|nr:50S ribosomal protein L10 [Bdellovibrionales bacterium]